MAVAFTVIPSSQKHPGVFIESQAIPQPGAADRPSLLFGQRLASGTTAANTLVQVADAADADARFGIGSMLAQMCAAYFKNDPNPRPLYAMPVADPGGLAATRVLNITGPATANGTLHLYVAGQHVPITVTDGDAAGTIATAIQTALGVNEAAAVNLGSRVPVTAAAVAAAVTLTARHAGLLGNQIDVRLNYLGAPAETTPEGVGITELPASTISVKLAGGTLEPVLTTPIANILDRRYTFVGQPWDTTAALSAFKDEFADGAAGRWGPNEMTYGHVFMGKVDTYANLSTFATGGTLQQDPHLSCFATENSPSPPWEIAAAFAGVAATSFRANPAKPLNRMRLIGILAPAAADRFTRAEREVLLDNGLTVPLVAETGEVYILRAVTTYFENPSGGAEDQWLDVTTPFKLDTILTELAASIDALCQGKNLADDGTLAATAPNVITANTVRNRLFALYDDWELRGLVENGAVFREMVVVERNSLDPNRLDVLFPPDVVNDCQIVAILNQWRLSYTAAEKALAA